MQNPVAILVNETRELQGDFDIQTDKLISARRPAKKGNLQKWSILLSRLTTEKNEGKLKE